MNYAEVFHTVSLVWAVVALLLLLFAWRCAVARNLLWHRRVMMVLTAGAWLFLAGYAVQYRIPEARITVAPEYIPWLAFHGTIGLLILVGITLLVLARLWQRAHPESNLHFNRHHQRYGRVLVLTWAFTHVGGIVNYWLFF